MAGSRPTVCVALDSSDYDQVLTTAKLLAGQVEWLKIGLEAYTVFGASLVTELNRIGCRVFLDLKLHDIPNTVRRAAANCARTGADMFNVHVSGGRRMMEAAAEGANIGGRNKRPLVLGVTVLTSLDDETLTELGFTVSSEELVIRWARLAQECGLDGVVASAREARAIRSACGSEFLIVTPGIRPTWSATNDQRRIVTPIEAAHAGADVLVIGRPISQAPDPAAAARRISDELLAIAEGNEPI